MTRFAAYLVALFFSSTNTYAVPTKWQLLNDGMGVMGTFLLDIDNQSTSEAILSGDLAYYTVSSRTYLNARGFVGPFSVNNYMNFFSTDSGTVYRNDYGGGEYSEIRINEAALEIGTPNDVLKPDGSTYAVFINEIYNYDEINVYCSYYDEIYDPDTGDYIGNGACAQYDSDGSYNIDSGYWYSGFLRSLTVSTAVSAPSSLWLLLIGLFGLAVSGKSRLSHIE